MPFKDGAEVPERGPVSDIDDDARIEINKQIFHIIADLYNGELVEIIGDASGLLRDAGLSDDVPYTVNNQIRNTLNHIGRACVAVDAAVAIKNIGDAKKHLYVAKCLALASSIETVSVNIDEFLFYVSSRQETDLEFLDLRDAAKNHLKKKRQILSGIDVARRGSSNLLEQFPIHSGIANSLDQLLADQLKLQNRVRRAYELPSQKSVRAHNKRTRFLGGWRLLVTGFSLGGIVTSVIASIFFYFLNKLGYFVTK